MYRTLLIRTAQKYPYQKPPKHRYQCNRQSSCTKSRGVTGVGCQGGKAEGFPFYLLSHPSLFPYLSYFPSPFFPFPLLLFFFPSFLPFFLILYLPFPFLPSFSSLFRPQNFPLTSFRGDSLPNCTPRLLRHCLQG